MKLFTRILFILALAVSSQNISADTLKFEAVAPSTSYNQIYPNLDLHQINSIKITATTTEFNPDPDITRLEIVFPFATNLIASNFVRNGTTYRALVNDAWVFKQIMVEVEASNGIQADSNPLIRLYVVETTSNLSNPILSDGYMMLNTNGFLMNTTPNKLADVTTVKVDLKNLILRLYQRPQTGATGHGFYIHATWLGHGEADIYIPAMTPADFHRFNAVAVNVTTEIIGPDTFHFISIDYTDKITGQLNSTSPEDLRLYLDQAFPQ